MILRQFVLILFITGAAVSAIAQDTENPPATANNLQGIKTENPAEPEAHGTRLEWKDLPANLWRDQKAIATSPFHINRGNAKWWVLFGTGTAALLATDRTVSRKLPESNTQLRISRWASR